MTKEINLEVYDRMKSIVNNYQTKYKPIEKIEINEKKIFALRRKIKQENNKGHTSLLKLISVYSSTKDDILELYIKKLYNEYFPQETN